jgi:hypothetical protein
MKILFSAVISSVLLIIYVYLVWRGIEVVQCIGDSGCDKLTASDFNDRMASSLSLIGGLVSALVIAELSVTKPGDMPSSRLIAPNLSKVAIKISHGVTGLYLVVWLITGLAAFFFGYLIAEPGALTSMANLGQSWLGIAVGAGYAYFGIKP